VVSLLRWIGLIAMVSIAAMRCVIEFVPDPYFDVDPAITPGSRGAAGPLVSLALDVTLLMSCAAALLGEALAKRRIDWRLLVIAAIGAIPVIVHGVGDLDDLWRGSCWLAAVIGAVAAAHLARDPAMRNTMLAVLLAAAVPVIARGAVQTLHEHAQTVATFRDNAEHILRQQGIEPGSPSAAIYERRLLQNQPLGWFITTNVFATMMAATMIISIGLVIAAVRARLPGGWTGAIGLVGLAAAAGLGMTGSKGAIGVAAIGALLLLLPMISMPIQRVMSSRFGGWVVIALIALVLLSVIARGTLLPEGFAGDKSLLFRWHYMAASARIIAQEPLVGTGPDHFQQFYTLHRVPRNPEEVASAHSVFIDWLATLGLGGGAAWTAVAIVMLYRAGRSASSAPHPIHDSHPDPQRQQIVACIFASLALIFALAIEWNVISSDPVIIMSRVLGVLGFLAIAVMAQRIAERAPGPLVHWSLAAGAITLMMHSQIEMTLTQPNAAVWGLMLLGAAAASEKEQCGSPRLWIGAVASAALVALSVWIAAAGLTPLWKQHLAMRHAAESLRPIGAMRWNLNQALSARDSRARLDAMGRIVVAAEHAEIPLAMSDLEAAMRDGPRSAAFAEMVSTWDAQEQLRRTDAATALIRSGQWRALLAAAEQLASLAELAAREGGDDRRRAYLEQAVDVAEQAADQGGRPRATSLAGSLAHRLASITGDSAHWSRAIDHLERLAANDPHGIGPWMRLGDALWDAGRRDEAIIASRRALENDANFELDPLKQLTAGDRARLIERVNGQ
jgi:O-antigen ligase/tetratricopeptide (TPR) repeat protein